MSMNWSDPAVQSAVIQAVAAVLAAFVMGYLGKMIENRKKLQRKLVTAQQDIAFLLAVEALHCEHNLKAGSSSLKLIMRAEAKVRNKELKWSGQFTPGRANDSKTMRAAKLACATAA